LTYIIYILLVQKLTHNNILNNKLTRNKPTIRHNQWRFKFLFFVQAKSEKLLICRKLARYLVWLTYRWEKIYRRQQRVFSRLGEKSTVRKGCGGLETNFTIWKPSRNRIRVDLNGFGSRKEPTSLNCLRCSVEARIIRLSSTLSSLPLVNILLENINRWLRSAERAT